MTGLAVAFAEGYRGRPLGDPLALEARLAGIVAQARARWPGVTLADADFVSHLAARLPADVEPDEALAAIHASDVYLACACALGAPGAVQAFHDQVLARLPLLLAAMRLDRPALDEARQMLADHLLVARNGAPPRIAEYTGRGPLEGWLRIVGIRTVLNARRGAGKGAETLGDSQAEAQLLPGGGDPELEVIKTLHKEDFASAFRAALDELTPRERTLLGMHFLEGVPTLRLAPMYRVHRTTVARWIETAQQSLLDGTRRQLVARLQLSAEECESLIALLRSRLDVTLRTILGG